MRLRKRKWVDPFLLNEKDVLIKDFKGNIVAQPVYLEIGMGMGDWIVNSCLANPDILYLGLEKDPTCTAKAILKAKNLGITNLKILRADASLILELMDAATIDRIFLHFSDPWPKKGHHKRRLTYPDRLATYWQLLKNGGELIFKSDNVDFFNDSIEYFEQSPFEIVTIDRDYHKIERSEPLTGYEARFKSQGIPINFLLAKKK